MPFIKRAIAGTLMIGAMLCFFIGVSSFAVTTVAGAVSNPDDPASKNLLQKADELVFEETRKAGLWNQIWQFPVVLIPIGSKPGKESVVLRPVFSRDAMTVQFADLPQEFVHLLAEKLLKINEIENVFFDVTHKPPGTIEWE